MDSIDKSNSNDMALVWLNTEKTNNARIVYVISKLRWCFYGIRLYDEPSHCFDYINSIPRNEKKVFLIVPSSIGKCFVKTIGKFSQVFKIYIYCVDARQSLSPNNLHEVYNNTTALFRQLAIDVKDYLIKPKRSMLIFIKENTFRYSIESNESKVNFEPIRFKLIIETLLKITPSTDRLKQEFLNEIRSRPEYNQSEEKQISEFEKEYNSCEAISWYTRDRLFYRMINKGFRTENIDIIFRYRFFFVAAYNHLKSLHEEQRNELENISVLYRGQFMNDEEFKGLEAQIGSSIVVNSFWSTTKNREIAEIYSGNGERQLVEKEESIVYKIYLERDVIKRGKQPFACVERVSSFADEEEYIFAVGTVFRVENIRCEGARQIIELSFTDGPGTQFDQYMEYYRKRIDGTDGTLQTLVSILIDFNQCELARKYLQASLLEEDALDEHLMDPKTSNLIEKLSANWTIPNVLNQFLQESLHRLRIVDMRRNSLAQGQLLTQITENMTYRSIKFYFLGLVNYNLGECEATLFYFDRALDTIFAQYPSLLIDSNSNYPQLSDQHPLQSILAKVYFHIALVHFSLKLYSIVISVLSKAYVHCRNVLLKNVNNQQDCELLVLIYYLFGRTYCNLRQDKLGINYYRSAVRTCITYQISPMARVVRTMSVEFAAVLLLGSGHNGKALKLLEVMWDYIEKYALPSIEFVAYGLLETLNYYEKLSDEEKSQDILSTFRQNCETILSGSDLIKHYKLLAEHSIADGAYHIAMESLLQLTKVGYKNHLMDVFIGCAYYKQNQREKALFYFNRADTIFSSEIPMECE